LKPTILIFILFLAFTSLSFVKIKLPEKETKITSVPTILNLDTFYKKHISVNGIPVVSSEKVPDAALIQTVKTVKFMLAKIPDVTTNIPEHSDLNIAFPETNWDTRARGLGPTLIRPAVSCAEENVLAYQNDPYKGEDILIHEFTHAIHQLGISFIDPEFDQQLNRIFNLAKAEGLWKNTYAMSNASEYFAEGVQSWFNVNQEKFPSDGIHNEINTRKELKEYDPRLYQLISKYFLDTDENVSPHFRR
jgi:hypothetical protein